MRIPGSAESMLSRSRPRVGATAVECAVILPVLFFLLFGMVVGAMGVFRYQEVAWMAREAARYASVHGYQYQSETGNTSPTTAQIESQVFPQGAGLDMANVTVFSVTLNTATGDVDWDASNKAPYSVVNNNGNAQTNWVTVKITYRWTGMYLTGPIDLTSTSKMPMSY